MAFLRTFWLYVLHGSSRQVRLGEWDHFHPSDETLLQNNSWYLKRTEGEHECFEWFESHSVCWSLSLLSYLSSNLSNPKRQTLDAFFFFLNSWCHWDSESRCGLSPVAESVPGGRTEQRHFRHSFVKGQATEISVLQWLFLNGPRALGHRCDVFRSGLQSTDQSQASSEPRFHPILSLPVWACFHLCRTSRVPKGQHPIHGPWDAPTYAFVFLYSYLLFMANSFGFPLRVVMYNFISQ